MHQDQNLHQVQASKKLLHAPPYSVYSSVRITFFPGKHVRNSASLVFLRLEYVVQTLKGERKKRKSVTEKRHPMQNRLLEMQQ